MEDLVRIGNKALLVEVTAAAPSERSAAAAAAAAAVVVLVEGFDDHYFAAVPDLAMNVVKMVVPLPPPRLFSPFQSRESYSTRQLPL